MQDAFLVQFTNEAQREGQTWRDWQRLNSSIVTVCENFAASPAAANQAADMIEFRVDDTHGLMVGLMLGSSSTSLESGVSA